MTTASSHRIRGAVVGMFAAAAPMTVILALYHVRSWEGAVNALAFLVLPTMSGLISGATVGARIADRWQDDASTAALKGAGMAVLATIISCAIGAALYSGFVVVGMVGWSAELGRPGYVWLGPVGFIWFVSVDIPFWALAGLLLRAMGATVAATQAVDAASQRRLRP